MGIMDWESESHDLAFVGQYDLNKNENDKYLRTASYLSCR